jgi:fucose 4-O-acetylase-like acetyltransferase
MRSRDWFVDAVRAFGTVVVVLLHWLIPVVGWDGQRLQVGNALSGGAGWLVTWVVQVMPLMFFAGGAATRMSLRPVEVAAGPVRFLRRRLRRLLPPVLVFLACWTLIVPAATALGVPRAAVERAATIAPQLLWFVAVYALLLAVTPWCVRLHERFGLRLPAAVAVAAVLVDVVRFGAGVDALGWVNVLLVWLVPYLLGFSYADGRFDGLSRRALAGVAVASVGALVVLVAAGPYPLSMVGLPGDRVSNMSPPTVCLLAVAGYQLAFALLARGLVLRLVARPAVGRAVVFLRDRSMTLYLWHLTAMFVLVGVVLFGFGGRLPAAWGEAWWVSRPVWYLALAGLLAVLVRAFSWVERGRPAVRAAPAPVPEPYFTALL